MSSREYTQDEKAIMRRARIADDAKQDCEQAYLLAVYAAAFDPISPRDAVLAIREAYQKMIAAHKEYDAAMTAYREMMNRD